MIIKFEFKDIQFTLPGRNNIKEVITSILSGNRLKMNRLTYIFCKDRFLLRLNKQFLNHDTFTDVITFSFSDPILGEVGEVYISIDRVKENAKTYEYSFLTELSRVIFHGALHLAGYNDKSQIEKVRMKKAEETALSLLVKVSSIHKVPRGTKTSLVKMNSSTWNKTSH